MMGGVRHVFTHFSLDLRVLAIHLDGAPDLGEGEWWPIADIDAAGLPAVCPRGARRSRSRKNEA
jgi:A/G-specific adenine glycosylase